MFPSERGKDEVMFTVSSQPAEERRRWVGEMKVK